MAAGIAVIAPDARLIAQLDLPAQHHTNLAISPDGAGVVVTGVDDIPGGGYRGALYRVANPAGARSP
jgi:gluconolactonase